tara:strand:+ start:1215 stop:1601 length:387 start_codon:yes stop_codon:yes gene_type:complete
MLRLYSTVSKFPIIVTNSAWNKMGDVIKKQEAYCFYLDIKSGGCSGFSYDMKLLNLNNIQNYSKITMMENGDSKLLIEPSAEMFLLGTTIDYVEEDYSKGIFEKKFTFTPDKDLATTCGCGISFNPNS